MSHFLSVAPEPSSNLARHRILSPTAGVKVSPLCLGSMNFGEADKKELGECSKETAFEILDWFHDNGGNFIDTAVNYQSQQSEQWLGEWMKSRKCRDEMVIATKFTTYYRRGHRSEKELPGNYLGNSAKNLHTSIKTSLANLGTDYVDVLYVHFWDFSSSIEEVMQALNREVQAGRVLYLGISDTPAWVIAKANQYARDHGMKQFSIYQGAWNCAIRDIEREVLPLCQADGMAIAPWRVLGGGAFKTQAEHAQGDGRKIFGAMPQEDAIIKKLSEMASKRNTKMTSIAMAFVMASSPDVYPIIGTRKLSHIQDAAEALSIRLTDEELSELRTASQFDTGFPLNLFAPGFAPTEINAKVHFGARANLHLDVPTARQPAFPPSAK